MADYGFPRDPWRSNSDFWSWTQTADNVLWPDPTALREESCKPSPNADAAACAAVTLGTANTKMDCKGVGSAYIGVSERLDWAAAEAYCVDTFGGHLASIHSEQGQANAVAECTEATKDGPESLNKQCWIGMSDIDVEGTFVWSDASPVDYRNFVEGEPNDCRWTGSACDGDPNTYPGEVRFPVLDLAASERGLSPCLLTRFPACLNRTRCCCGTGATIAIGTSGFGTTSPTHCARRSSARCRRRL